MTPLPSASLSGKKEMRFISAFCRYVNTANEWVGRVFSMLFIPLVFIVMIEVVLRYFFNKPTIWGWDTNIMLTATIASMGAGYALLYKRHVIVDILVGRFSPRVRAIIDLVTSPFFFLPIGLLLWVAIVRAERSVLGKELYSTLWEPPLYPLRILIAIGFFLFLMQGIVKFIRDIRIVTGHEIAVDERPGSLGEGD